MKYKKIITILFVLTVHLMQSQTCELAKKENKFLDRDFWKSKPTIETVENLIKEGNSLTEKNSHSVNAMTYAILEKTNIEVLKYLLQKGLDINELTHDKRTYIFWAAYKDNMPLVKLLLKKGAKTDLIDSTGYSIIQFMAVTGNNNPEMYDLFIKEGQDVKSLDKNGRNLALLYGSKLKENLDFLKYFSTKGIDYKQIDNEGNSIFTYACKTKNKKVLEALIAKGVSYKTTINATENAFTMATGFSRGNKTELTVSFLQYLENLGFDPKFENKKGNTALHNASFILKETSVFEYLLSKGLDVNKKNEKGNTPFSNASMRNSKEVISILIKSVKNINTPNQKGESALTYALQRNKPEIVSYLIENGADVTILDRKQNDLFYHLIDSYRDKNMNVFLEKMNILKNKGLKIDSSKNLLHLAVRKNKTSIIKELLANTKFDINTKNSNGYTPLQIAVMMAKNTIMMQILINKGADKNIKTSEGETLMDLAKENEILANSNVNLSFLN